MKISVSTSDDDRLASLTRMPLIRSSGISGGTEYVFEAPIGFKTRQQRALYEMLKEAFGSRLIGAHGTGRHDYLVQLKTPLHLVK